jgi:two-component system cell cycle response regulator
MSLAPGTIPTVLIASADMETVHRLSGILDAMHYPTEIAHDGLEALQRLSNREPPIIALLDTDLSSMGGVEILGELRRRQEQRVSWTMLMSESIDMDGIRIATDAGADDFLLKPIDEVDLKVRMRVAERVQALTSQLQRESAAVRFHATHDSLTGTWNRETILSLLFQETDRVQRMKTPLTLMLLDLDGFDRINLEFGYESGDRVLRELGARFRRFLRSYDLVGRCGEDEFLIALPGCTSAHAPQMAERIAPGVLKKPFQLQRDLTSITASIGIAHSRGRSPLVVLREAERALAEAKMKGRNCICDSTDALQPLVGDAPEERDRLRTPLEVAGSL